MNAVTSGIIYALVLTGLVMQASAQVNVRSCGAAGDGRKDDSKAIQKAVDKAKMTTSREVFLPAGHYLIGASIVVPSDFTIRADKGAYIELKRGSNQYLLRNEDLRNGNRNITVTGGHWNGNGWSQTRTIRDRVDNSEFCFGLFFYRVSNLRVSDMQIDSTRSWGIAYMECDTVHIHDIRFHQNPFKDAQGTSALLQNGDGVTGGGDHVLIENISGFTNDDLVAFASGGASFQGRMAPFPAKDYRNVTVRRIYPQNAYDSIPALKAVAFYTFGHTRVSDITIEDVKGNTAMASVLFYSLFRKKGYFSNVKVRGVEGTNVYSRAAHPMLPFTYGVIGIKNSEIDSIDISGIRREERRYNVPQLMIDDSTTIGRLRLSDVEIRHAENVQGNLLLHAPKAVIHQQALTAIKISSL
ncbi:glycosyl hydrolase family 28-related protein [Chitinophaga lutea]